MDLPNLFQIRFGGKMKRMYQEWIKWQDEMDLHNKAHKNDVEALKLDDRYYYSQPHGITYDNS